MSTQIIDNFKLNTNLPIDSRIVASGSVARDAIVWKYDGLRVYDISDHVPYVWIGTTSSGTWSSENLLGVSGTGTASYFAVFNSLNVIKSSNIYQSGSYVGINKNNPTHALDVNGTVYATNLKGDGSLITNINASNISSGNLSLNRMPSGTANWLLGVHHSGGIAQYKDPNLLTVGYSLTSYNSNVASNSSSTLCNIYFGTQSGASDSALKYNSNLKFKPSTGQIFVGGGTESNPGLVLGGGTNDGLYYNGSYIGLTIGGDSKIKIAGLGNILAKDGYTSGHAPYLISPAFSFMSDSQTGMYRKAASTIGFVTTGVDRVIISDNGLSVGGGSVFSQMFIGKLKVGHVTGGGASAQIINATGFSIYGIPTWNAGTEEVRFYIMTNVAFKSSTFSVICSIDDAVQNKHYQISCLGNNTGPYRFWFSVQRDSWSLDEYVTFSFIAFCN